MVGIVPAAIAAFSSAIEGSTDTVRTSVRIIEPPVLQAGPSRQAGISQCAGDLAVDLAVAFAGGSGGGGDLLSAGGRPCVK